MSPESSDHEDSQSKESIVDKRTLEKRLSISSKSTDSSSYDKDPVLESDTTLITENNGAEDTALFEGKKSLFSEDIPLTRTRSTVITKKISLPTFNSAVSLDDNINNSLFDMSTSTQVWTFGKNSYGQLGHGDLEDK